VTPDGRTLVSAGEGGVLWVWDLVNHSLKDRFFINDVAEKEWMLWEAGSWLPVGMAPKFHEAVTALAVSPNGKTLAAASSRGEVTLWDLPAARLRLALPARHDAVRCLAFSPVGQTLAVNDGSAVRLWDLTAEEGPRVRSTLTGRSGRVRCLAFAPSGHLLAVGGEDRRVVLWDLEQQRETALGSHTDTVQALAFALDGRTLASGGADGKLKLWHVSTEHELFSLPGHSGPVRAVVFSPDGKTLASGGVTPAEVGEAFLWQASAGEPLRP
jgi:WD40 repeat protein